MRQLLLATVVLLAPGNNDCAFRFVTGQTYIVYARRDSSGQLVTDTNSGTRIQ